MTSFASLLPPLIGLVLASVFIAAAIIAHRGKPFWGTWMMMLGGIGAFIGAIGVAIATFLLFQSFSSVGSSGSSPAMDNLATYRVISGISSLLTLAGLLSYLVGLLALAIRYGALGRRVSELETITTSLMSEREQTPH